MENRKTITRTYLNVENNLVAEVKLVYSVAEVATILGVNRNKTYELIEAGVIKAIKFGKTRITLDSVLTFLKNYDGYDLSNLEEIKLIKDYKETKEDI